MYLTQSEYIVYGGADMEPSVYERLEFKAESFINRATYNRIRGETPVREAVKRCVFDLIRHFEAEEQTDHGAGVQSVSNDGVSVTYSASREAESKARAMTIVRDYLAMEEIGGGITLLFKGVFS